jgi:group I intron endonuclease
MKRTKKRRKLCGAYRIVNIINGRFYRGSSTDVNGKRWSIHLRLLRKNEHYNDGLQADFNTYGESAFVVVMDYQCDPDGCYPLEQVLLDFEFEVFDDVLYNENRNAIGGTHNPTKEHRANISAALKGREFSPAWCEKIRVSKLGNTIWLNKRHKQDSKAKIGEANADIWEGFITPDGTPHPPFRNLRKFCREHNLNWHCMRLVYLGKQKSHRGWQHTGNR